MKIGCGYNGIFRAAFNDRGTAHLYPATFHAVDWAAMPSGHGNGQIVEERPFQLPFGHENGRIVEEMLSQVASDQV